MIKNTSFLLATLALSSSYASGATYYFFQPGWQIVQGSTAISIIQGSFTATDSNNDNFITKSEIASFLIAKTGATNLDGYVFQWTLADIDLFSFSLTTGNFLGNDGGESFSTLLSNGNKPAYSATGGQSALYYQPEGGPGAVLNTTNYRLMIDTSPISSYSYGVAAGAAGYPNAGVPEPSTYGLMGLGAIGIAFAVRRKKKTA